MSKKLFGTLTNYKKTLCDIMIVVSMPRSLRLLRVLTIVCYLFVGLATATSDIYDASNQLVMPEKLESYALKYNVLRGGKVYGSATRTLEKDADSYVLSFETKASFWFYEIQTRQISTFSKTDHIIMPLTYSGTDKRSFKDLQQFSLDFVHSKKEAEITDNQASTIQTFDGNLFDPLLSYEVLRFLLDSDNASKIGDQFFLRVMDKKGAVNYRFVNDGQYQLDTPFGSVFCTKITRIRENSKRRTHIWFAVDYDNIPVKVLQEKDNEEIATLEILNVDKALIQN